MALDIQNFVPEPESHLTLVDGRSQQWDAALVDVNKAFDTLIDEDIYQCVSTALPKLEYILADYQQALSVASIQNPLQVQQADTWQHDLAELRQVAEYLQSVGYR